MDSADDHEPRFRARPRAQLSEPIPTPTGMLLVHLDKRLPVDEKKFEEEKAMIADNVARGKREAAFDDWLKAPPQPSRRSTARAG